MIIDRCYFQARYKGDRGASGDPGNDSRYEVDVMGTPLGLSSCSILDVLQHYAHILIAL